jgi:hypothetical protein
VSLLRGSKVRTIAIWAAALLLAGVIGFGLRGCGLFFPPTTLNSLSPDDTHRVTLVERRLDIDRNFELRLENLTTGRTKTVFRSPDEGRPVGSERIVWSADSSRFVVLGHHFYIADSGKLASGELAYLMMELNTGKIWCNSEQQAEFPRFGLDDLTSISWDGWTPE